MEENPKPLRQLPFPPVYDFGTGIALDLLTYVKPEQVLVKSRWK